MALKLLDDLCDRGLLPDIISFNSAISACESVGQWETALNMLDEMRARGITPDIITNNSLISCLGKVSAHLRIKRPLFLTCPSMIHIYFQLICSN